MRNILSSIFLLLLITLACKKEKTLTTNRPEAEAPSEYSIIENENTTEPFTDYKTLLESKPEYISKGFNFPVGKPDAKGYYNAQKFQENDHLGDDWNGVGGGNSDLGDAIYSIGNGYISEVKDYQGGWGNVVRVVHLYNHKLYESLYAHCDTILVKEGEFVTIGDSIATIGNNNGQYYAHLHLELRDTVRLDIGGGYSTDTEGYLDPTLFIKSNRN